MTLVPTASEAAKVISLRIGEQLFALDIMAVREIRGWTASTPLPDAPTFVLGVINLRGAVLPVMDLGARLGHSPAPPAPTSVVVVADLDGRQVGLLVDAVCDIVTVASSEVQSPPDVGSLPEGLVRGLLPTDQGIIALLALERVLPQPALAA